MTSSIIALQSTPGIDRDSTTFSASKCVDGQWVRWDNNKYAKKMPGYTEIARTFAGPVRGGDVYTINNFTYVFAGSSTGVEVMQIDQSGGAGGIVDRTPVGLVPDVNNVWQMSTMFDAVSTKSAIIAHGAPNLLDISSSVNQPVYYGDVTALTALATTGQSVSGGAVPLQPYLFVYGNDGELKWSVANKPNDFAGTGSGSARICGQKIVKGVPVRGGSNSPAGLFWSLDELYKVSFVGGDVLFRSDFVADTVLLSTSAVVEMAGLYFWPTIDGFAVYNGTVQQIKNSMNRDYFFEGLNFQYRQKVWGTSVKKFGEIWWFYPRGENTECSHYIVYNMFLDEWYDGELGRSWGHPASIFRYPLQFGVDDIGAGKYQLWQHEFGTDSSSADGVLAIQSYFETADLTKVINAQSIVINAQSMKGESIGDGENILLDMIEPDFTQMGDMTVTILGRNTARGPDIVSDAFPFTPSTETVSIREQRRELRLRFESNVQGGDFEAGQILLHIAPGDRSLLT